MSDRAIEQLRAKEKAWLLELRKTCCNFDKHLNNPEDYFTLEEWRQARTNCFTRGELWLWEKAAFLVCSVNFDYTSALFIVANSVVVGVNTDWVAQNIGKDPPFTFRVFDLVFCVIFTVELTLRLFVH